VKGVEFEMPFEMVATLGIVLFLAVMVALMVFIVKSFGEGRKARQKQLEAHRLKHGGEHILEWDGQREQGTPDTEFGALVVAIPKRVGSGKACFYEKGVVVGRRRLAYRDLKDLLCNSSSGGHINIKEAARDMSVIWLYPKKGSVIGIRALNYKLNPETIARIQHGLGC